MLAGPGAGSECEKCQRSWAVTCDTPEDSHPTHACHCRHAASPGHASASLDRHKGRPLNENLPEAAPHLTPAPMDRPRGSMKARALVCWNTLMAERASVALGSRPAATVTISLHHHSPSITRAARTSTVTHVREKGGRVLRMHVVNRARACATLSRRRTCA